MVVRVYDIAAAPRREYGLAGQAGAMRGERMAAA